MCSEKKEYLDQVNILLNQNSSFCAYITSFQRNGVQRNQCPLKFYWMSLTTCLTIWIPSKALGSFNGPES